MNRKKTARVILKGGQYLALDISDDTTHYTSEISLTIRQRAFENNNLIEYNPVTGKWNRLKTNNEEKPMEEQKSAPIMPPNQVEDIKKIHSSYSLKPERLKMNELKWKFLYRSALRGKNIMMTGPAGSGKTAAAKALAKALDREEFYFNLGATQDPRSALIGNTQFKKDSGTYFAQSLFVKAIQTENAIILLDELSRAHPEAWNILMTVLDQTQRYLRLDEQEGTPTIKVADGVTFIATANIGSEYTATRVMDRALLDRFTIVEMDVLNKAEELGLLKLMYPAVSDRKLNAIAEIADMSRKEVKGSNSKIRSAISTRASVEMGSLLFDGFTLKEAAEVAIIPFFDADGGADSERTYIMQIIQKYGNLEDPKVHDASSEDLFNADDISDN